MNLCKAPTGLIVNSLQNIAFSSAARLQDNLAIIRNGYSGVLAAMALMTLPVFSLLSQHADVVLRIVYGNKWLDAAPLTTALAIAMPAVAMGTITAAILRGTGAVTPELRIQIFSVSALTVLLLLMVGKPLTIAVIAVPIVYWCRLALLMLAVGKRLKMRAIDFYVAIRGGALLAGIGIGAGALSKSWLSSSESLYGALPLAATCCSVLLAALVGRSWLVSKPLAEILQYRFLSRYSGRLLSHITGARK
jgi:O-antigen/teichoic acid export membrane protein